MKKLVVVLFIAFSKWLVVSASALSFGVASNDAPKLINANGQEYKFIIGTASKTGKYYAAGTKLCQGVAKCIAAETDGSKQNLELLSQGYINGAIVQADAYNTFVDSNPNLKDKLVAADLGAEEQVQIVMRKGGDEDHLQNSRAVVYVGTLKSGGAASWLSMATLEKGYSKAAVVTDDYSATSAIALNKLRNGEFTAIIRTSQADLNDPFVKQIANDPDLEFVNVDDKDINDEISVNGKPQQMYRFTEMSTAKGFIGNKAVVVPAVKVLFVFNKDMYSTTQLNEMLENIHLKKSGLFK